MCSLSCQWLVTTFYTKRTVFWMINSLWEEICLSSSQDPCDVQMKSHVAFDLNQSCISKRLRGHKAQPTWIALFHTNTLWCVSHINQIKSLFHLSLHIICWILFWKILKEDSIPDRFWHSWFWICSSTGMEQNETPLAFLKPTNICRDSSKISFFVLCSLPDYSRVHATFNVFLKFSSNQYSTE